MSMESPGAFNQASSYTAEVTRRAVFSPYARTSANTPGILAGGTLSATDLVISPPGSGLSVSISTGEAIVGGGEGGTQGAYYARNASTTSLSISTANPSNPRIDTVALTIADSGYTEPTGVSGNAAVLQVVTGTPTSGANLTNLSGKATLPLSSLLLGYVLVPASASNIVSGDIANKATVVGLLSNSNYLRLPSGTSGTVTWGLFQTGSGTVVNGGSGDWTLSGLSTGIATVNFPTRNVQPAVIATIDTGGSGIYSTVAASAIATNSATITTWNISSTLPPPQVNAFVSFAVIG